MWTREQLKTQAKDAVRRNYWMSVLVGFIALIAAGSAGYSSFRGGNNSVDMKEILYGLSARTGVSVVAIIIGMFGIMATAMIISTLIAVFIRNPLEVGVSRFFLKNAYEHAGLGEVGYSFSGGQYLRIVGTMVLKQLFIFLWTLLFIIPGIIKVYDYYLVEYIIADDPTISVMDALAKSRNMMRGHRWNTFVLNLSFIPWLLLSVFTFGILAIFYVNPYIQQTDAQLYIRIKEENNYYN